MSLSPRDQRRDERIIPSLRPALSSMVLVMFSPCVAKPLSATYAAADDVDYVLEKITRPCLVWAARQVGNGDWSDVPPVAFFVTVGND